MSRSHSDDGVMAGLPLEQSVNRAVERRDRNDLL
jgi:hypothetical protein